jgi:DNA-binding transcriptional ArsR family regulator
MGGTEDIVRVSRALSVAARVRIVGQLRGGALCVGALSARLGISQSALSQHLRVLREAGLVAPERRGYYRHYSLREKALERYLESIRAGLSDSKTRKTWKGGERTCAAERANARSRRS